MTTTNSIHMGAGAPEPFEAPGSGSRGVAQSLGVGREFRADIIDDRWAAYGMRSFFGTFLSEDGEETPKRYQLIMIDKPHPVTGKRVRMTLVKSPSYRYVPNEVALTIADKIAEENGLHPAGEPEYTSDGLGVYKRYLSDRHEPVAVGDAVAVGFQVKNGVDGMMSHRYTGYTLRLVCTNGMIAPRERTSFKVGSTDPVEIEESVRAQLGPLLEGLQEELEEYRSWTRITVNMRLANLLAAALPKNLLSSFMEFAPKSKAVVDVKPITVWEAFNHITDPLTHQKIEARHRDWLRVRLSRTISVWQAVEAGKISEDEAMAELGAAED